MKRIIIGIIVLSIIGVILFLTPVQHSYTQEEAEVIPTEEVIEEPTVPEEWLKEAEAAKEAVLDRKAKEQELNAVESQIEALEARQIELLKALDLY